MATKITKFDKQNLQDMRAALVTALAQVENQFGVKLAIGNISYSAESFKCQIQAILSQAVSDPYLADVPPKYVADFNRYYKTKLLARVKSDPASPTTYVIVGKKGSSIIVKLDGKPTGGLYKLPLRYGNFLFTQLTN